MRGHVKCPFRRLRTCFPAVCTDACADMFTDICADMCMAAAAKKKAEEVARKRARIHAASLRLAHVICAQTCVHVFVQTRV